MSATNDTGPGAEAPLNTFANCHAGILRHLGDLDDLPMLLAPARRARRIAEEALEFFRAAVFEHHAQEESELFPAVLKSASPGAERDRIRAMTERLTQEHRAVEALWKSLEPGLKEVAKGHDTRLDPEDLARLVRQYAAHAAFEEAQFLPLCHDILSRNANHMEALSLSLHMRAAPAPRTYV